MKSTLVLAITLLSIVICTISCTPEDGKDGQDGAIGSDGQDGADGTDGQDGVDGTDGQDGINGQDGADGSDGLDGVDGSDGIEGENGLDGTDGKEGSPGMDACTLHAATLQEVRAGIVELCDQSGGVLCVRAGIYEIVQGNDYVHINCDNITLRGEGPATQFNVSQQARTPAIVVGDDRDVINDNGFETLIVSNVSIEQIAVHGGWDGISAQTEADEYHTNSPFLRNNGIYIRFATFVTVDNVTSTNNRSGGITTEGMFELPCEFIEITNSTFSENYFDGLSFNRTVLSRISGNIATENQYSGFTSEYLADSVIEGNFFVKNADHGAYLSDSYRNSVVSNQFVNNTSSGVFLSRNEAFPGTVSKYNAFSTNVFSCNAQAYDLTDAATCIDEPNLSHGDIFQCNHAGNNTDTCVAYWDSRTLPCPDTATVWCAE